jgi:hypothetical protein
VDQKPRPIKRMSDIGGPRRPLDLRNPTRPEMAAPTAAAVRPSTAPLKPTPAPIRPPARNTQAQAQQPARPEAPAQKGGAWKTILQFIIGVVIIVLVAFSIVVLYVKYYAG